MNRTTASATARLFTLACALAVTLPPTAHAAEEPGLTDTERDKASTLIRLATRLMQKGDYEGALAEFKRAEPLTGDTAAGAAVRFNIATLLYRLGRKGEAARALQLYNAHPDEGRDRDTRQRVARELMAKLMEEVERQVRFNCSPADAELQLAPRGKPRDRTHNPDHPDPTPCSWKAQVKLGAYTLTVLHEGYRPVTRTLEVPLSDTPEAPIEVAVTLEPYTRPLPPTAGQVESPEATPPATPEVRQPMPEPASSDPWPWVAAGAGGVALIGGVILTGQASDLSDEVSALPPGQTRDDKQSDFESRRDMSYVAYGIGAVALVTAGALWWFGQPDEGQAGVSATPGGVAFRW